MKKESIIWLLFPVIWGFWFFFMQGHISHWEGTNFFQCCSTYWDSFAFKPSGWSEYMSHFILQFYQWSWIGASIQTLLAIGIFISTRGIIHKVGIKRGGMLLSSLPLLLIFALQNSQNIELNEILKILLLFIFTWIYMLITHSLTRYTVATLISPIIFLFLGGVGTIALYIAISLYELCMGRGATRIWFIALWIIIAISQPFIWQKLLYTISMEDIYGTIATSKYIIFSLYGYIPTLFLIGLFIRKRQIKRELFKIEVGTIILLFIAALYFLPNWTTERLFSMEHATIRGNWDDVLELAKDSEEPNRNEMFMINLALAMQGKLGDHLFDFSSEWGSGGLQLFRDLDYETSVLGGELYYRLNIPNEAIHWTFQGSVDSPQGMNFRVLKRLIELNILKQDRDITNKYLSILENTTNYNRWCIEKRREIASPSTKSILPSTKNDFFIGSRPFMSDLARVIDADNSNRIVLDYMLCHLLLERDLTRFCQLLDMLYKPNSERMPKAYQEAILMALASKKITLTQSYPINSDISRRFTEYNSNFNLAIKNRLQAETVMSSFNDTWWYYASFSKSKKIGARGEVVPILE